MSNPPADTNYFRPTTLQGPPPSHWALGPPLGNAGQPPAKPITFQLESSQVAFAVSYLQGIVFNHYMALLWFDPNNLMLSNWLAFIQEFSTAPPTTFINKSLAAFAPHHL
ncbi:hypothetical protein E4T56_gene3675 [Termitomyces sp. T112]|nr:hypothetical protein E4T56_gene3675 [Termitomyces sp. T112]